jgi:hypothetical protein
LVGRDLSLVAREGNVERRDQGIVSRDRSCEARAPHVEARDRRLIAARAARIRSIGVLYDGQARGAEGRRPALRAFPPEIDRSMSISSFSRPEKRADLALYG